MEFEFVVEMNLVQIGTNEFFPQLIRLAANVCSCLLLMPPRAHSISAGRPTAPDTAAFPVLHGLLELAQGIAVRCLCLGDFFPHCSARCATTKPTIMSHHWSARFSCG